MPTPYIANRAFSGLRKFRAIYKDRQIADLAFNNESNKNKIQRFGSVQTRKFIALYCPTFYLLNAGKY
jgi:hypothetical protein